MIRDAAVVVVGAGAFGTSVAYHLARLGQRGVVLVDQDEVASQTSPRAAGLFKQARTTDLMTRLAMRAVAQIERFAAETGEPLVYHRSGALMLARTPTQEEHLRHQVALGQRLGLEIDLISPAQARQRSPFLETDGVRAVSFTASDLYLEPGQIPRGYARAAARLGVTILENTRVLRIEQRGGALTGVVTDQGPIRAPVVVAAAGAWNRLLGETVGVRIPIVPTRHQLLITQPIDGIAPEQPIVRIGDAQVYLRPEQGGLMLGGYEADPLQLDSSALVGLRIADLPLDLGVLRRLADRVLPQFPILRTIEVREHRGGLPTLTPDGNHVVGPVAGRRGFWVIGGCCVAGLSISPSLGEALAAWIVNGEPPLDLSPLAVDRFGPAGLPEERLKAESRARYAETYSSL